MTPALKRQLESYARRNHMTVTATVVFAIVQFIKQDQPEPGLGIKWNSEK